MGDFRDWPGIPMPGWLTGGWEDYSYRNDVCGAAYLPLDSHDGRGLRLWVEHPDREDREIENAPRFALEYVTDTDMGWCDGSAIQLWEGEDETDCRSAIAQAMEKYRSCAG